jgi:hypothetical protein
MQAWLHLREQLAELRKGSSQSLIHYVKGLGVVMVWCVRGARRTASAVFVRLLGRSLPLRHSKNSGNANFALPQSPGPMGSGLLRRATISERYYR